MAAILSVSLNVLLSILIAWTTSLPFLETLIPLPFDPQQILYLFLLQVKSYSIGPLLLTQIRNTCRFCGDIAKITPPTSPPSLPSLSVSIWFMLTLIAEERRQSEQIRRS